MKILFNKGPVYTTFGFVDADMAQRQNVISVVDRVCKAKPDGYIYMPSYKAGHWDGYIKLNKGNKFPTGLLDDVLPGLNGHAYEIADAIEWPPIAWDIVCPSMCNGITLRDYQFGAIQTLLKAGNGVAKMATNAGKTAVEAAIAKAVCCPVILLTMKKDLLCQLANVIGEYTGETVGMIGGGHDNWHRVTVATIQTLIRHKEWVSKGLWGCVMFDEVHHVPSKTSQEIMLGINAPYRFGFSGTPLRYSDLNDLLLVAAAGPIRVEVTNQDLIEAGVSATPTIFMYYISDSKADFKADWRSAYDSQIVDCCQRNDIIVRELEQRVYNSALVLVDRLEHGNLLSQQLPDAIFVSGKSSIDDRMDALVLLREGNGAIVIATPIFDEGVDVPAVDLLVLASGGVTNIKLLQRIGRGMRRKEGSNQLQVIDFVDDTNKYLLEHSLARAKIYEGEGFQVEMIQ